MTCGSTLGGSTCSYRSIGDFTLTPLVVVVIPEEEGNGEHEIQGEATFIEREEADKQAFLMGKAWIDRKEAGDVSQEEISSS